MATPSLNNLNQNQTSSVIDTLTTDLNSINTSQMQGNLSNYNKIIEETKKSIDNLNNSVLSLENNSGGAAIGEKFDVLKQKYEEIQQKIENYTKAQIDSTQQVINNFGYMNGAINSVNETIGNLKNVSVGDPEEVNKMIDSFQKFKDVYLSVTRDTDISNITRDNVESVKKSLGDIIQEVSGLSDAFNIGGKIVSSINDGEIKNSFSSLIQEMSNFVNNLIPTEFGQKLETLNNVIKTNPIIQPSSPPQPPTPTENPLADSRYQEEIERNIREAVIKGLQGSLENAATMHNNAKNYESHMDNISTNTFNAERNVKKLNNTYNSHSYLERKHMDEAGINESSLGSIDEQFEKLMELSNLRQNKKINTNASLARFNSSFANFEKNPTKQNMDAAQAAGKDFEKELMEAAKITSDMSTIITTLEGVLGPAFDKYDKLPDDVKKILDSFKQIRDYAAESADDLTNLGSDFPSKSADISNLLKDGVKESNKELSNMSGIFDNLKKDAMSVIDPLKSGFNSILSTIGSAGNLLKSMGMGVGLPLIDTSIPNYIGNVVKYYKEFGEMDRDSALSQLSQGANNVNPSVLVDNRNTGIELYGKTNGIINERDYSNMSNNLIGNVQGHYGQGNYKTSGINDMQSLTRTALDLNKLYGVDSQSVISAFYKELNMGATETENMMLKLADTAQSANIPVSQYVKTIADMAVQFKDAGISMNMVNTGMRNMVLSGMSVGTAQGIMNDTKTAMNTFSNDWGSAAYFGMSAGVSDNPFGSIRAMQDRWKPNGDDKDSATDAILSAMDSKIKLMSNAWGDGDSKWIGTRSLFKQMGYSDKNASMMTNEYLSGNITGLKDLMTKADKEQDKFPGQDSIEEKITTAGNYTDELTKATIKSNTIQMGLAEVNKDILDMVGKGLQKVIAGVGAALMSATSWISKLVTAIGGIGTILEAYILMKAATSITGMKGITGQIGKLGGISAAGDDLAAMGLSKGEIASSAFSDALKFGSKKIPIAGGLIDGAFKFGEDKMSGKTTGYSTGESVGDAVGTGLGMWGGAAAGAAIGSIIPGAGTLVGGLIGLGVGALGGWAGGKAGTWVADKAMNAGGVQEYESGYSSNATSNASNSNSSSSSDTGYNYTAKDFYDQYGINESIFDNTVNDSDNVVKNTNAKLQNDTNNKIDDMKNKQTNLMEKSNSISKDTYDLNNEKYGDMIDKAKTQMDQLTNIAKITDAGFTFLDKILNSILQKIGTGGGSGSGSGSSGSVNTKNLNGGMNGNNKLGEAGSGWEKVDQWDSMIESAAKTYGVDPNLIKAVMMQESSGINYDANSAGAVGLMQITKGSAEDSGIDWSQIKDPQTNINAGAAELARDLKANNEDIKLALAAYNAGQGAVNTGKYLGYNETMNYIQKVPDYYQKLLDNAGTTSANSNSSSSSSSDSSSSSSNGYSERHNQTDVQGLKDYQDSMAGFHDFEQKDIQTYKDNLTGNGKLPWEQQSNSTVGSLIYQKVNNADYQAGGTTSSDSSASSSSSDSSGTSQMSNTTTSSVPVDSGIHYNGNTSISSSSNYNSPTNTGSSNNRTGSTVYVFGSEEYSNQATTSGNPLNYYTKDGETTFKNLQGQARGMALYYDSHATHGQYTSSINSADDYSTSYNSKKSVPDFQINISAAGANGVDYDKMAQQIQSAVTNVVQQNMGSNSKVAASNYQRAMSQY